LAQQTIERGTNPRTVVDEPNLLPNELLEVAVSVAAAYFVDRATSPDKERQTFRQDVHDFCSSHPQEGPAIVLAGLKVAGFDLVLDPPSASAPHVQPPEQSLDQEFFHLPNWHNVVPTLIDMGEHATWDHSENPRFDPAVTAFAQGIPSFTVPDSLA
jgi:hypothetical protein